jgi:hypothetical protein
LLFSLIHPPESCFRISGLKKGKKKAGRSPLFGQTKKVESALSYCRIIAPGCTFKQLTWATDLIPATAKQQATLIARFESRPDSIFLRIIFWLK